MSQKNIFKNTITKLFFILLFSGFLSALPAQESPQKSSMSGEISGSYRLRYEYLNNAYAEGKTGNDQLLPSRLLLSAKGEINSLFGEFELQDSRTWLDDDDTPLGTDDVNALEPLQAYIGWHSGNNSLNPVRVQAGRMTMNVGSRRLVARNRFRNTANAFTGVRGDMNIDDWGFTSFYTMPIQRRFDDFEELDANGIQIDKEYTDIQFWGLFATYHFYCLDLHTEGYFFGLNENDQEELATKNRDIYTAGGRVYKDKKPGQWDYEVEGAYQFGQSRASKSSTEDLDHNAGFMHAHVAYQFNTTWQPRLVLQGDYASGDQDPNDSENNRFETLYGARRFEYGPAGVYGAFARTNILTPGTRVEVKRGRFGSFLAYRAYWLADKHDAFTASGLKDETGKSGRFLGHQVETRLNYKIPGGLVAELGAAHLFKGEFLTSEAAGVADTDDTTFFYSQMTYNFSTKRK